MKLTVVGSGTASPEPDRVCAGHLLESAELRLLLDCGPGVVHGMARLGLDWRGITHLLLTHFHNDHIGDVPMLFFAWKHGMLPARTAPLAVFGPPGTKKLLERMGEVFGSHVGAPDFPLDVRELEGGEEVKLSDVARLGAHRTKHTEASLAFRVETESRSFCYTGDTGMDADLARFAQSVDALLVECSLPDDQPMDGHLTPHSLAAMARLALPRRLIATHCYPQLDRGTLPSRVREGGWPARVHVAGDGDSFEV